MRIKYLITYFHRIYDYIFNILNNKLKSLNLENSNSYKIIDKCNVCNEKTKSILDLGNQPFIDNYTKYSENLDYNPKHVNQEQFFPLNLHLCPNCFHLQINCNVNFTNLNYNYNYEDINNDIIEEIIFNNKEKKIIYIDFQKDNLKIILKNSKYNVSCKGYNCLLFDKLKKIYKTFDIIIVKNVFEHEMMFDYVKQLMNDNSYLYIEANRKNMIFENKFDLINHKTLNFFNTISMNLLCNKNDLILCNVFMTNKYDKNNYVFEISKKEKENSNLYETIKLELENGIYLEDNYIKYKLKCLKYKNDVLNKMIDYKLKNKQIIAFGSSEKAITIFNFCNITNEYIDFIIDENNLKHNLFTPGSNIIVCPICCLKDVSKNCVVIVSEYDLYDDIKEEIKNNKNNGIIQLLNLKTLREEIIY
jgi:hypothetical protein